MVPGTAKKAGEAKNDQNERAKQGHVRRQQRACGIAQTLKIEG